MHEELVEVFRLDWPEADLHLPAFHGPSLRMLACLASSAARRADEVHAYSSRTVMQARMFPGARSSRDLTARSQCREPLAD
jgi:hypothetical protein